MNKKELTSDAKAVGKLIQGVLSATNMNLPLKEKSDNFFKNLISFLETDETQEDVDNKFNNQPQTIKKNLEFLMDKFTNSPTKQQEENIKESTSNMFENLNFIFSEEVKRKLKYIKENITKV